MRILFLLLSVLCGGFVLSAEVEVRTADGKVQSGEYLGKEGDAVKLKTAAGIVLIPASQVRDVHARVSSTPPAAVTPAVPSPAQEKVLVAPVLPVLDAPVAFSDERHFPPPRKINVGLLLAAAAPDAPEPSTKQRIELHRYIRNFENGSDRTREKYIRQLKSFGRMAEPFVGGAYTNPGELQLRVALMDVLDEADRPYTAGIFADVHDKLDAALSAATAAPAPLPPEIVTRRDRGLTGLSSQLRLCADEMLRMEEYASRAAGPYNALFLMQVYVARYTGDDNPLLSDLARDRVRLGTTAANTARRNSGWTPELKVTVLEQTLPLLFHEDPDVRSLPQELLKRLLPAKHPKWDAPEGEWVMWWEKQRAVMLR